MKKIYIEITNSCNLDCSFCIKNKRKNKFMSFDEFKTILDKISGYTNYLYFHVMGEPLLHPKINEFIDFAHERFYINITTNGYLINRLKTKNIRQLNISVHSYDPKYGISLHEYLNNIFEVVDKLDNTYISYRFWVKNKYSSDILDIINKHYSTDYLVDGLKKANILKKNVFINTNKEFVWPSLDNNIDSSVSTCYALRDHIGILSDGTVVPCCLDSDGTINLGNIFVEDLETIIKSKRFNDMLSGFRKNKRVEELCKHCNFLDNDE